MSSEKPFVPTTTGTLVRIVLSAAAWIGLIALLVVYGPARRKEFDQFGLRLPTLTEHVVDVSMWFGEFGWVIAPAVLVGLILVAGGYYLIRHVWRSAGGSTFWSLLFLAVPLLLDGLVLFSFKLAEIKLLDGLSR